MKTLLFLSVFLAFISCTRRENSLNDESKIQIEERTPIKNKKYINLLINSAVVQGSASAYNLVASYYILEDVSEDFLYTAICVANKYNNAEACYHVFTILNSSRTGNDINNLDEKTRSLALFYLLKSYEMGFESAKYKVNEIFGANIPNSSFYLEQYSKKMTTPR